jgi:hypothetical protein
MPRIMPEPRYFSMPSIEVGTDVRMKRALNCWPSVRSFTHSPEAVIRLSSRDGCRMADDRDQITVPACLCPENAESVLLIMEGDPLYNARQHFLGRGFGLGLHLCWRFCASPTASRTSPTKPQPNALCSPFIGDAIEGIYIYIYIPSLAPKSAKLRPARRSTATGFQIGKGILP